MTDEVRRRYVPIVAVVPADTVAELQPIVDRLAGLIEDTWNTGNRVAARMSGWTPEMLAWGRCLVALQEAGVELEINERTTP